MRMRTRPGRSRSILHMATALAVGAATLLGFQTASFAASSYPMTEIAWNNYCGTHDYDVLFSATATPDGSTKVDFTGFKQSAHVNLPAGCPLVTEICFDSRIFATVKGLDAVWDSSASFGNFQSYWQGYHEVRAGPLGEAFGTYCGSADGDNVLIALHIADGDAFLYGGDFKLQSYEFQSRARFYAKGAWHYGSWATFTKTV
jgi:hypothetical protein